MMVLHSKNAHIHFKSLRATIYVLRPLLDSLRNDDWPHRCVVVSQRRGGIYVDYCSFAGLLFLCATCAVRHVCLHVQ